MSFKLHLELLIEFPSFRGVIMYSLCWGWSHVDGGEDECSGGTKVLMNSSGRWGITSFI